MATPHPSSSTLPSPWAPAAAAAKHSENRKKDARHASASSGAKLSEPLSKSVRRAAAEKTGRTMAKRDQLDKLPQKEVKKKNATTDDWLLRDNHLRRQDYLSKRGRRLIRKRTRREAYCDPSFERRVDEIISKMFGGRWIGAKFTKNPEPPLGRENEEGADAAEAPDCSESRGEDSAETLEEASERNPGQAKPDATKESLKRTCQSPENDGLRPCKKLRQGNQAGCRSHSASKDGRTGTGRGSNARSAQTNGR